MCRCFSIPQLCGSVFVASSVPRSKLGVLRRDVGVKKQSGCKHVRARMSLPFLRLDSILYYFFLVRASWSRSVSPIMGYSTSKVWRRPEDPPHRFVIQVMRDKYSQAKLQKWSRSNADVCMCLIILDVSRWIRSNYIRGKEKKISWSTVRKMTLPSWATRP